MAILILAATLRLWRLDLVEFRDDESWALRLAEDFVRLGRVPLVGLTSSLGVQNPPPFIYLLVPIVALSRDPSVASAAVGLANVAGVAGVVVLGWRSFSMLGGLAAGLAYSTNPWAVFFARKVWAQDILAPLAILFFIALERAVMANSVAWAVASFPIFAIGVEIHFSFGLLAPMLVVPLGMLIARRQWVQLGSGLGLAVLTSAPYLLANYQSDWSDFRALQHLVELPATLSADGPATVWGFATSWDYWYLLGIHLDRLLPGRVAAFAANIQTGLVLLGLGVALSVVVARHADWHNRWRSAGVMLWLVLPACLTIRHSFPLYEHYYLVVPPASAVLIAAGITWLARRPARWGRPLLRLALASLVVLASIHTLIVFRLLDRLAVQSEPSYGPPLARTVAVAAEVVDFGARSGSQQLVVELAGPESQPVGYLARPYFPRLEVANLGQIGMGPRLARMPLPPGVQVKAGLGPFERLDLQYADGVDVLWASTSNEVGPADLVGLAITWVAHDVASVNAAGLVWEVSLYDSSGVQLARQAGIVHYTLASFDQGQLITSWFALATDSDTPPGQYEVRLRRTDPATSQPVTFADSDGRRGAEWRSGAIQIPAGPT